MADEPRKPPDADYFNEWYATMAEPSPRSEELIQRHLGLPPHLLSSSLLGWQGLAEVIEALCLQPGHLLLDLACGRGGYGLEVTRRTRARLLGIDFSAVAIGQARENTRRLGRDAEFRVGSLESTGLPDAGVDALLCVDAIQFASSAEAAYSEIRRVVRPGGRIVLTTWEAHDRDDARPSKGHHRMHIEDCLTRAGFADVEVVERPEWLAEERGVWDEAVTLDVGDDEALADLREEAEQVLPTIDRLVRLMAVASAP